MSRQITIPVAPGELLDKLTILGIKLDRIDDAKKRANVQLEHELLRDAWHHSERESAEVCRLREELLRVNEALWEIEDEIREQERHGNFDERFIELARSVYFRNDERAAIKKKINQALGSDIVEEKSYREYS